MATSAAGGQAVPAADDNRSGGRWMCVTSLEGDFGEGGVRGGFADVLLTVCLGQRQLGMQSQRSSVSR